MSVGGIFTTMDISASALRSERARMNVVANNLANANTTHNADGEKIPYRRKRVHFKPGAPGVTGSDTLGVQVEKITEDPTEFRKVYQPGHPDADASGIVLYPNVHVPLEMVDMMTASRAYEANITAMESAKQIIRGSLQIIA
ncbi:MAG: flagellar basal body rod protein FlgC [Planctomycetota bacterium]|jgi:flagellar basal-body rod protein FlgC